MQEAWWGRASRLIRQKHPLKGAMHLPAWKEKERGWSVAPIPTPS